jgi:hypothetical protein
VDLEQFYNDDPRRRHSEELEFGREWHDGEHRCEVSWVEATGEVYAMLEPEVGYSADGIGGMHPGRPRSEQLRVEVLGTVPGRDAIAAVMSGWEQAMAAANGLAWVRGRIANAASEMGDPPAAPSDDLPAH